MKYISKPTTVKAFKITGDNYRDLPDFLKDDERLRIDDEHQVIIYIDTLEGEMIEYPKEEFYVIKGIEGELYPCSVEVFEDRYEPVESDSDGYTFSKKSVIIEAVRLGTPTSGDNHIIPDWVIQLLLIGWIRCKDSTGILNLISKRYRVGHFTWLDDGELSFLDPEDGEFRVFNFSIENDYIIKDFERAYTCKGDIFNKLYEVYTYPLHEAVENNDKDLVRKLLSEGVDPLIRDETYQTPRNIAKRLGYTDIEEILAETEEKVLTIALRSLSIRLKEKDNA